ncbi:hypothetical protein M0802_010277 [Mischocyttarus mexicanus]|nr:hypothetical protein M0802_010277 [Mischocyttarus mexicanus]
MNEKSEHADTQARRGKEECKGDGVGGERSDGYGVGSNSSGNGGYVCSISSRSGTGASVGGGVGGGGGGGRRVVRGWRNKTLGSIDAASRALNDLSYLRIRSLLEPWALIVARSVARFLAFLRLLDLRATHSKNICNLQIFTLITPPTNRTEEEVQQQQQEEEEKEENEENEENEEVEEEVASSKRSSKRVTASGPLKINMLFIHK